MKLLKRKKLGRKLLSFVLALAMVVGLMPGMGLTAYAAEPSVTISPDNGGRVVMSNGIYGNGSLMYTIAYEMNFTGTFNIQNGKYMEVSEGYNLNILTGGKVSFYPAADNTGTITAVPEEGYVFTGWYNGEILYSETDVLDYKKDISENLTLTAKFRANHTHKFTYSSNANTITATCSEEGCNLPASTEGGSDHVATLTIAAPLHTTYDDGKEAAAVITDDNSIKGDATVNYFKATKSGSSYTKGEPLTDAPTDVGDYWTEITLGIGDDAKTAGVGYTIEKAQEANPAANTDQLNINYSAETISAKDGYEVAADNSGTTITDFSAILDNVTPIVYIRKVATDANHEPSEWVEVTLTARPDAPTNLTTNNADNKTSANGKINGVNNTMEYSSDGGNTWTQATGTTIDNLNPGVYLVRTKATADAPAGKTTEVKVGSKENILEDKQKPEAKTDLVYTGEEQSLVNAPADKLPEWATKIQYALGKDETTKPEASAYTDAIPTGADSGTYYVWYRVYVDDNNTSDPTLVTVEISPVDKAELNKAIKEAEDYYNTIKDNPAYSEQAKALSDAIKAAKELADNKNAKDTEVSAGITAVTEAKKKAEAEVKDIDDTAAAKKVIDAINALPASDKIATTDKAAIEAARKAYDALSADQKKKVPADVLKKLADAETALKAAEKDVADKTAADKVIEAINKLPASDKVATTDKAAIEAARKAYDALSADQKKKVPADVLKKLTDAEKALAVAEAADKAAKELEAAKKEAEAAMNEGITVTQKGKKFTVKWKKSSSADGYYVYASYCGKKAAKPAKTIKKNTTTKTTITKINGKKINQKKNFHVYVVPYKIIDGKKVTLGKSTVAHLVGSKNAKYSNVKKLTVKKKKYTVKVGKTAKIKAKITLVNKNKKHIPKGHGAKLRYKSSDTSIATVSKNGKIKGIKKGTCTIYVYSINGLTKKAKVTVK